MLSQLLSPVIWHGQEVSERGCDLPEVCGAVQASDSGQGPGCALHSLGDTSSFGGCDILGSIPLNAWERMMPSASAGKEPFITLCAVVLNKQSRKKSLNDGEFD